MQTRAFPIRSGCHYPIGVGEGPERLEQEPGGVAFLLSVMAVSLLGPESHP